MRIQCLSLTQFTRWHFATWVRLRIPMYTVSKGKRLFCFNSKNNIIIIRILTAFLSLFYIKQMIPFFHLKVCGRWRCIKSVSSSLQWAWMCAWHSNLQNINIQTTFELQHELYIRKLSAVCRNTQGVTFRSGWRDAALWLVWPHRSFMESLFIT